MKIWEKNYVLTMALLLPLLFGSLFLIQQSSFRKNLDQCCDNAFSNEERTEYAVSSYLSSGKSFQRLTWYCQSLQKQNAYLQVEIQGKILAGSLLFPWDSHAKKDFQIIRHKDRACLCIANSYPDLKHGAISTIYQEDISSLYSAQLGQMLLLLGIGILASLLLSAILYCTMRRIYAPVSNIAHELRTPLTTIQGYAQYISLGNITPEDIAFASSQIDMQAQHLNALIENLLIMGSLRNGEIAMERLEAAELTRELKAYFPFLSAEHQAGFLYGDKSLLLSLLRNLISNTCHQGEQITLSISDNAVAIFSQDDHIPEKMLRLLNKNRPIPKEYVQGRGLGLNLCHEILKIHHGTLHYQNLPEGGVEIQVSLWGGASKKNRGKPASF